MLVVLILKMDGIYYTCDVSVSYPMVFQADKFRASLTEEEIALNLKCA